MDKEQINKILQNSEEDIKYVETISNDIIKSRTSELDTLMSKIKTEVVDKENPTDEDVQKYFLELTNALYFITSKCEFIGFYEDITKTNAKMKYNQAYAENQFKATAESKKVTVADNQLFAENASVNETLVSLIYSRSYRIIKVKVDAAQEMIKTLSKILSSNMQEKQLTMTTTSQQATYEYFKNMKEGE